MLEKINIKNTITSLELLEQINFFRQKDGIKSKLQHYDLLKIIRNEFKEEITQGKISASEYKDITGKKNIMYTLTLEEGKQVLMRESPSVRRAVTKYIKGLQEEIERMKQLEYDTKIKILEDKIKQNENSFEMVKGLVEIAVKEIKETLNLNSNNVTMQPKKEKRLITIKTKRGLIQKIIRHASGFDSEIVKYNKLYKFFEQRYKVDLSTGIKNYTANTEKPISKISYIENVLKKTDDFLNLTIEIFPDGFEKVKKLYKTDFKNLV